MSSDNKAKTDECIQVVVRCRPLNRKELDEKRLSIIDIDSQARQVSIKNPEVSNEQPKYFTFDAVYDEKTQQKFFYDESCFNVIEGTLEGFNSTIFAYGQTGCGKSFTMQGPSTTVEELKGVIPNSFSHIFQFVKASKDMEVMIRCSYLELYNEEIKDLLGNPKQKNEKCELKEDPQKGVYVKGLTSVIAQTADDLNAMLERGLIARTTAATNMNAESSRSHSIFTIVVEMNTKDAATGKDMVRVGKLNLVDLAGSERQKKTGATDATLKEGIKINLSLSALGNVISALSEGSKHVPYRDSKLTRLLQDSLGGNTKTMMIAAISPADYNFEETMSTLRYANRAKNIKNKPKINEDPKDTMIREFKEEIERLRKLLAERDAFSGATGGPGGTAAGGGALMADMLSMMALAGGGGGGSGSVGGGESSSSSAAAAHLASGTQQAQGSHLGLGETEPGVRPDYASPVKQRAPAVQDAEEAEYSPDKDHGGTANLGIMSPAERERSLREDVENRLHQLENMLVHDNAGAQSLKLASARGLADQAPSQSQSQVLSQPWAPTAEEIEEEEEAARQYERRRQEARRKRDAQQARELQRMQEERRAMEEELEELRASRASSSGPAGAAGGLGSASANASGNGLVATAVAEVEAAATKRLGRMKRKYEKKLAAAREALEDLQEDFSYQRKQFVEAATEQEKDLRLYELICKSLLSDRDFKKILEKSRYDEETDEWIVPFIKKKNLNDGGEGGSGNGSTLAPLPGVGVGAGGAFGGNGSKMFPDINGGKAAVGGGGGFASQAGSTLRDPGKLNGGNGWSGGGDRDEEGDRRRSPVPLLTLPGNLLTPAALAQQQQQQYVSSSSGYGGKGGGGAGSGAGESRGGFHLPQISSRSDANSARQSGGNGDQGSGVNFSQVQILPQQPAGEKKKKSKAKAPKSEGRRAGSAGGGIGYGGEGEYGDQTDQETSSSSSQHAQHPQYSQYSQYSQGGAVEAKTGEEGAGEPAGPLEDWGFAYQAEAALHSLNGKTDCGTSEADYSEDEDFETAAPTSNGNGASKARKSGGKKKKKASSAGGHGEEGAGGAKSSFALPPI